MIDESVRRATMSDVADLDDLQRMARDGVSSARGGPQLLDEQPAVAWDDMLSDDACAVWVALLDDIVLGYLELDVTTDVAVIRQVFVHPEARQLGLGDALVAEARLHAITVGCRRMDGVALPGDRDTKNLFERAGITARKIVVSVALSDPATAADASR